jgi:prevent-host-death family protein
MTRMSATDAARGFSDVLTRVSGGEEIEVIRAGAPVAVIVPPRARALGRERFRELMASAPSIDEGLLADVRAGRRELEPPEGAWPS